MSCCSEHTNVNLNELFTECQKNPVLSEREKCLIRLAIAFTTNHVEAVKRNMIEAKHLGITNEELEFICTFSAAAVGTNIVSILADPSKSNKQGGCCT